MNIITKAYQFAKQKHKGQTYAGGEFIDHPCQIVKVLAAINADMNLLSAGYLVDTLEDTETTYEELEREFNTDIASLVKECTKTAYNTFPDLHSRRGILLKLADRIVNVKNITTWDDKRQAKYLQKTLEGFKRK